MTSDASADNAPGRFYGVVTGMSLPEPHCL